MCETFDIISIKNCCLWIIDVYFLRVAMNKLIRFDIAVWKRYDLFLQKNYVQETSMTLSAEK